MPESILIPWLQSWLYPPIRDLGFGLWVGGFGLFVVDPDPHSFAFSLDRLPIGNPDPGARKLTKINERDFVPTYVVSIFFISVADSGCLSRIRIFSPGSWIQSQKRFRIPDPHQRISVCFTKKIFSKLSDIYDPGWTSRIRSWFSTHPGSRNTVFYV
jgi:hypothetical protein